MAKRGEYIRISRTILQGIITGATRDAVDNGRSGQGREAGAVRPVAWAMERVEEQREK